MLKFVSEAVFVEYMYSCLELQVLKTHNRYIANSAEIYREISKCV